MMWRASAPAHFDPSSRQYGMNWPGDFESLLRTSLLEAIVLWAVLRPWSFNSFSRRLGGAAALFTLYLGLRIIVGVHGGPIIAAHDLWLLFLCWECCQVLARSRGAAVAAPPNQALQLAEDPGYSECPGCSGCGPVMICGKNALRAGCASPDTCLVERSEPRLIPSKSLVLPRQHSAAAKVI